MHTIFLKRDGQTTKLEEVAKLPTPTADLRAFCRKHVSDFDTWFYSGDDGDIFTIVDGEEAHVQSMPPCDGVEPGSEGCGEILCWML